MTNYITSVGVQHFSISMSNASSGTATITAVGSGAFIIYGGFLDNANGNPSLAMAYLQKTSSTVITATRNGNNFQGPTVTGCIIDGDTTNLIKSVQQGTISISASTSGTASINPVTSANTAVHFMGSDTTSTTMAYNANLPRVSLSGTTVTAATAASGTNVVAFEIIEFQSTPLTVNAVQQISAASSSSVTSYTASITSVTTGNTVSIWGGDTVETDAAASDKVNMYGNLSASNTFTININTASTDAKTYNASIVEFNSGVLNSSVQRGTVTLTAQTSNTASVSPSVVKGNSGISFLNLTTTATAGNFVQDAGNIVLTNGTTVTGAKSSATSNITESWEVFEFPAFGAIASGNAIWFGAIA